MGPDLGETFGGLGNDFIHAGTESNIVFAGEGDDWIEGGEGNNLLQGDNGDPFLNSTAAGNDIFLSGGGDDDYDAEGGDDVMEGGAGIQRFEGLNGFDWATYQRVTEGVSIDMLLRAFDETPIPPSSVSIMDRFDAVEGVSGSQGSDIIRGSNQTAIEITALNNGNDSVLRNFELIRGLREGDFGGTFDATAIFAAGTTSWGDGDIILGGGGSDLIEGRLGDDIIDGDLKLGVRILINDDAGAPIATAYEMQGQLFAVDADGVPAMVDGALVPTTIGGFSTLHEAVFGRAVNPGDLLGIRELIDEGGANDFDIAEFSGIRAEYAIETLLSGEFGDADGDGFISVTHLIDGGGDGADLVRNIERLNFSDQSVNLSGSNTPATGAPVVLDATGAPVTALEVGDTLSVDVSGIVDADGLTNPIFAFTWEFEADPGVFEPFEVTNASGEIGPLEGQTITVPAGAAGFGVRVVASFQDDAGVFEEVASDTTPPTGGVSLINEAPAATDDVATTDSGVAVAGNVLANDVDANGDALTAALTTAPLNGSITMLADGSFVYTPNLGFVGDDEFTYVVTDTSGLTDTATVTITVGGGAPANTPPVAVDDDFATSQGVLVSGSVLANDTDADGDALTASLDLGPANGTATVAADGTFTYTPDAGFVGIDDFFYAIDDGNGGTDTAVVTITVAGAGVNTPPVAVDDVATTTEGVLVAGNVLTNDTDADGDALTASLDGGPANGTATVAADGTFTYTPDAGFTGADGFFYVVDDGNGGTDTGTVTVTVDAAAGPNAIDATAAQEVLFGTSQVDLFRFELGDSPRSASDVIRDFAPGDQIDISAFGFTGVRSPGDPFDPDLLVMNQLSNGVAMWGVGDKDFLIFVRSATESDVRAGLVLDGGGVSTNTAPVAVDDAATTTEGVLVSGNVLSNDIDAEGDVLTATFGAGPSNGSLTLNSDGSFDYTPNVGFVGTDFFFYTVDDGNGGSDTGTALITVNAGPPVNTPPIAVDDLATTEEGVVVSGNVLANDTDADGDALTAALDLGPANGTLSLNADGTFDYTPNAGFVGTDDFFYVLDDGNGGTDTASVSITVTAAPPVNTPPVAADDTATTEEGVLVSGNVLSNDTDADGDALSASLDVGPTNGALSLNADGSFDYTPNAGFTGTDSFTYTVDDGNGGTDTGTVTITVDPADPGVSVNIIDATPANEVLFGTTEVDRFRFELGDSPASASDVIRDFAPGDQIDVSAYGFTGTRAPTDLPNADLLVVNQISNGVVMWGTSGKDFQVFVRGAVLADVLSGLILDGDGGGGPVNSAPVAVADSVTTDEGVLVSGNVLSNDADADGDALTASLDVGPSNGVLSLSADGSFDYTPNAGFSGTDSFTYIVSDGNGGTDTGTATITVSAAPPVNTPPIAVDDIATTEAGASVSGNVLANDTDADGDTLTASLDLGPANGTATVAADGSFTYTPNAGFTGTDDFFYAISDGNGGTDTATVSVTVSDASPINTAPVAVDDAATTDAGILVSGNVLLNDTDADGDVLSASLDVGPANGLLSLNADGSYDYTPNAGFTGTDFFTYIVSDGNGGSDTGTATLTVNATSAVNVIDATAAQEVHFGTADVDLFRFELGDSTRSSVDVVRDFAAGDQIDVSAYGFTGTRLPTDPVSPDLLVTNELSNGVAIWGAGDKDFQIFVRDASLDDVLTGIIL